LPAAQRHSLAICRAPSEKFFYWVQKAMLGSSVALNVSRRPLQPFGRQHPGPPAPFAACQPLSAVLWPWAQKGTLGSSLALNASRRPLQLLLGSMRLLQLAGRPAPLSRQEAFCRNKNESAYGFYSSYGCAGPLYSYKTMTQQSFA